MIRELRLKAKPALEDGFLLRGESVSRLEAFSDAVFGLAIALVIVSDYGQASTTGFTGILLRMERVPAIAACFATIYAIWGRHYLFCRRFGLEDTTVRVWNGILLFVVALYAYPLMFLFDLTMSNFIGLVPLAYRQQIDGKQVPALMALYGAGWAIVHLVFAALYWHAWRRRGALSLSQTEQALTRLEIGQWCCYAAVGASEMVLALLLPVKYAGLSGFTPMLLAVVGTIFGHLMGEARKKLAPLEKLEPVAEGVPAFEPVDAGNRD